MKNTYKLAAAALLLGASLLPGTQSASTAAEVGLPQLAFGPLGAATNATSADVFVVPTDDTLNSMEIGSSQSLYEISDAPLRVADGNYSIDLDPSDIPAGFLSDDGIAFVKIMLHATTGTYQTGVSARLVHTDEGPMWVDPNENLEAFVDPPASRAARPSGGATRTDVSEYEYEDDGVLALPPVSLVASGGPTAPQGCSYTKLDTDIRNATIGTTYPLDGDVASMQVSSSAGAEYGTAVSIKGTGGSFGAFKAAESKFTKSSWGFNWTESTAKRSYRKGIQYGLYELSCVQGCSKCSRQWYPTGETGGTGSNTGIVRPTWETYCAPEDKGTFWRDDSNGKSYAYGAGVKFADAIGIDLSVNRNYTSSQKIYYTFSVKRRLCGNNDYPADAGKLIERLAS